MPALYISLTQQGQVVSSVDEAEHVYVNTLNKGDAVVKAMVLSGGRGLGTFKNGFKGGVHLATNLKDVKKMTESMLGQMLVTKQSGPDGIICNKVSVCPSLPPSLPPSFPSQPRVYVCE
jgi:succinyl-CoA synthetase beta subunit